MTQRWRGHGHPELYNMIHAGPGAGASDEQTAYWQGLTNELTQVDADLNKALNDLKVTWQGSAAQSADSSMTPLQAWASDAQTGSSVMRLSTEDQAEYIASARAEMPKPVEVTTPQPAPWEMAGAGAMAVLGNPGPAAMVALQAADHERQEAAQSAAADKAVDTMNTYESSSTWNRNTLGTFVAPPEVVVATPPPAGAGASGGVAGGWLTGSAYSVPQRDQSTHNSSFSGGGGGGTVAPVPSGDVQGANAANVGGGNGGQYSPLPHGNSDTTPEGYLPPTPSPAPLPTPPPPPAPPPGGGPLPLGGLPLPGTTSLPGGSGPGGKPAGLPSGAGARGGVPGLPGLGGLDADGRPGSQLAKGGVVGMGVPGEGVVGRGAAGAAGAGARGGALGGGPMGMGAGTQGDEDDEHFAPDYLLETTDVFGDERVISPAVIGGDNPTDEEK